MTPADYRTAGLEIANTVSQTMINKAEADVFTAYVQGAFGDSVLASDYPEEIMILAYCLLMRRNLVKTRFGAEQKQSQYSINADADSVTNMVFNLGYTVVRKMMTDSTLESEEIDITDIANIGIYTF